MTLDLSELNHRTLLITGGTGMIGKWMIDRLRNDASCRIIVTGRSADKFRERFSAADNLTFLKWDVAHEHLPSVAGPVDYIIHLASNTHPVAYATDPVGTIVMNVSATKELLDLAVEKKCKRFVYASSVEIYGQNRGDVEKFKEDYCGYIDSNTLRAGYPESKRCGEALCQAYIKQYGIDMVIPRIARVYGPTLQRSDTKALSQFIFNALAGKDVVLKSEGKQHFSYLHVADAVSGILTVMLKGKSGVAYNIADEKSDVTLRELAELIAASCGRTVAFDIPSATESAGFSPVQTARMDSSLLKGLGWVPQYDIRSGIVDTMCALKEEQ